MTYFYSNQCRICLVDGAIYPIFEEFDSKDSIYSKLFQCFNEKIENVEGYPEKICETCFTTLNTVYKFVIKFKTSSKLLECGLTVVKKEVHDDNFDEIKQEELEIEICKREPFSDFDGLGTSSSSDDLWEPPEPEPLKKKENKRLSQIKAKLECLKDININKHPAPRNKKKSGKCARSKGKKTDLVNKKSLTSNKANKAKDDTKVKEKTIVLQKQTQSLCDTCGMVFEDRNKLTNHRRQHKNKMESKCLLCNRSFKSQIYMKRHMVSLHDERKLFCESCGKGFCHRSTLRQHIQNIHVGRKKHVCDKCDKVFLYAKGLLIHERAEHLKIRPVVCEVCGANFLHEDYLKEHKRLHTGETPFKCPVCSKGFAQRCNMKSHIKHNHRLADLNPEIKKTLKPAWLKYFKTI